MEPFTYIISSRLDQKKLQKSLPSSRDYRVSLETDGKSDAVLLDTFESELFCSDRLLFQAGERLLLMDLQTGECRKQLSDKNWLFASDLPEGPVTALLQSVSPLRAFLPVAGIELQEERGRVLDDEGKTRVRFNNLTVFCGRKMAGVGGLSYLRGYDRAYSDLRDSLKKTGVVGCNDAGQVYEALKIKRQQYTAKPVIRLDPLAAAGDTARVIIRTFLGVARQNEKGVIADYDTEFLHQYRVSLRKVRSVIGLFKGVFEPQETEGLKQDFAALMQKTGVLRDLDVYLLDRQRYLQLVPEETHTGLKILFDYFLNRRKKEQKKVSKSLKSKSYLKEISRLEKIFGSGASPAPGTAAKENSLLFAGQLIRKRYRKVCKIARTINSDTEDKVVHQLRINCKKLRYLMEFFSPLFPAREMKTLIKALKALQDNLGLFNDYSVQQVFLRQLVAERIEVFGEKKIEVAESVGALVAMLHRLQKKERRQVMKNFMLFDSPETRDTIAKLFQPEGGTDEDNRLLQQ